MQAALWRHNLQGVIWLVLLLEPQNLSGHPGLVRFWCLSAHVSKTIDVMPQIWSSPSTNSPSILQTLPLVLQGRITVSFGFLPLPFFLLWRKIVGEYPWSKIRLRKVYGELILYMNIPRRNTYSEEAESRFHRQRSLWQKTIFHRRRYEA